jgi:RimJ/RimL family protein N-acetyltransferase
MSQDPVAATWYFDHEVDIEDAVDRMRRRSEWSLGTEALWAIVDRDDTEVLGGIGLLEVDAENRNAEVGYALLPSARGRGYAAEALTLASDWGLGVLGLQRISLFHAVENEASCGVATRANFALEGTLARSHRYGDGELHDEHLHARVHDDVDSSS